MQETVLKEPYAWLEDQLPDKLAWNQGPLKFSMKKAPENVKAALIRLDRIDASEPPKVLQIVSMSVVNKRDVDDTLTALPKEPTAQIAEGTYKIEWAINYANGAVVSRGSKVYHDLEAKPVVVKKERKKRAKGSLEKKALARLERDDKAAQARGE